MADATTGTRVRLHALCIDAQDPQGLARFWAEVLGREVDGADVALVPPGDDGGFPLRFLLTTEAKSDLNRMHVDLTSESFDEQGQTVARALRLGGRHFDVGQLPEEEHVVLADPEGNEFCVIEPGNHFLEGCGRLGALSCDGSQAVGHFWSEALGWPLVWDQAGETAIQSPRGGPKIAWGGPPVKPKRGRNRLHLDLAVPAAGLVDEVERLVALGAERAAEEGRPGLVRMLDPDGNEFCLLAEAR